MTPERHARIKDLFLAADALPPEERADFLRKACGEDADLRAQVEELLKHQSEAGPPAPGRRVVVVAAEAAQDDPGRAAPTRVVEVHHGETESPEPIPRNFPAGTVIGGRYRIVTLLGFGGMGEVYRADDLTLNQPVALKFLPTRLAKDAAWLTRLRREVRVARRVTHPHVCRVHDIAEADGDWFISMEYVDGENLCSLLKRIGRLPEGKALEIAQQICAGIAAAHARKVVHCDLKPDNVMIDGRGRAVITDFGLAVPVNEIKRRDIRAGTPAYMAPEQLTGKSVTFRSDLYGLGLVLYELFTGQPAFHATTPREYAEVKLRSAPAPPSQIVPDINPDVERVILRCLERDPRDRPRSALAVLAELPGADPLAAALAAGETPWPEWIAAARTRRAHAKSAVAGLAGFFVLLLAAVLLSPTGHPARQAGLDKSPQVLAEKARDIIAAFASTAASIYEAYGFAERLECPWALSSAGASGGERSRFVGAGDSGAVFWYRSCTSPLVSANALKLVFANARASLADPPGTTPGAQRIVLDPMGRLVGFETTPLVSESASRPADSVDWSSLLARAGLDAKQLHPTAPRFTSRVPASQRIAWLGSFPGRGGTRIRVEGAAYDGAPVSFAILAEPLSATEDAGLEGYLRRHALVGDTRAVLLTLLVVVSVPLVWRNVRLGRSDFGGSLRLAGFVLAMRLIAWLLEAPHASDVQVEFKLIRLAATGALAEASLAALFYMALEPLVRRFWPHTLVAWSRILAGRIRDPFVGLNVLLGALLGVFWTVLVRLDPFITSGLGWTPRAPLRSDDFFSALMNTRQALGFCADSLRGCIYDSLFLLLILALTRAGLQRRWMANVFGFLLIAPMFVPRGSHPVTSLVLYGLVGVALGLHVLTHFGLVPIITAMFINQLLQRFPLTPDMATWYADSSVFALLVAMALAASAYLTARRPASRASVPGFA